MQHTANHFCQNDTGPKCSQWQRLDVWAITCCVRHALGCDGRVCGLCGAVCVAGAPMCLEFKKILNASEPSDHPLSGENMSKGLRGNIVLLAVETTHL